MALGDLAGGDFRSRAFGVNADGTVVVGNSTDGSGSWAYVWTEESGMVPLESLEAGATSSLAYATSHDGTVIVGHVMGSAINAVAWTGLAHEVSLLVGGDHYALGVSGDGLARLVAPFPTGVPQIVTESGSTVLAYGTTQEELMGSAEDADFDGSVVVGTIAQGVGPFIWVSGSGARLLGDLAGGSTEGGAAAANDDGTVVVGACSSSSGIQAFRWTGQTGMVGLGGLPGGNGGSYQSGASDVSGDGSIVVGSAMTGTSFTEAFIWDAASGNMRRVAEELAQRGGELPEGWTLTQAEGIGAYGTAIVGTGTNSSGDNEAWRVTFQ